MSRRTAIDRPRLLNDAGERLIADAFAQRSRTHMSWGDCAEVVIFTLQATGLLPRFEEPGIDAIAAIQAFNRDVDRE